MKKHISRETVRYIETDRMKVAHHSSYLIWFEASRTGLMDEAGYSYRTMEENGILLPVVAYHCKITHAADYDDSIEVETWIEELRSRSVTFAYNVLKRGKCIATGWTRHICINGENKSRRIPADVVSKLKAYAKVSSPQPEGTRPLESVTNGKTF